MMRFLFLFFNIEISFFVIKFLILEKGELPFLESKLIESEGSSCELEWEN